MCHIECVEWSLVSVHTGNRPGNRPGHRPGTRPTNVTFRLCPLGCGLRVDLDPSLNARRKENEFVKGAAKNQHSISTYGARRLGHTLEMENFVDSQSPLGSTSAC